MRQLLGRLASRLRAEDTPAEKLYLAAVAQARTPAFYSRLGVPDTVRGRFELICLHVFLEFRRLKSIGPAGRTLAQEVHDLMFADMDRSLRELGIGDMGIGKRVKSLASNLYGRIRAYDAGLAETEAVLSGALRRNLYGTVEPSAAQLAEMVAYVHRQWRYVDGQSAEGLLAGEIDYAAVDGENLQYRSVAP